MKDQEKEIRPFHGQDLVLGTGVIVINIAVLVVQDLLATVIEMTGTRKTGILLPLEDDTLVHHHTQGTEKAEGPMTARVDHPVLDLPCLLVGDITATGKILWQTTVLESLASVFTQLRDSCIICFQSMAL